MAQSLLDQIRLVGEGDIPPIKISPLKRPAAMNHQFTRLYLGHLEAVARCKTVRAAMLFLAILRYSQLSEHHSPRRNREAGAGVRVPTEALRGVGLGEAKVRGRATKELVELGLIRAHHRPGFASLLELLAPALSVEEAARAAGCPGGTVKTPCRKQNS